MIELIEANVSYIMMLEESRSEYIDKVPFEKTVNSEDKMGKEENV